MHQDFQLLEKAEELHKKGYKLLFLGDYVDSFDPTDGVSFLREVISLIKQNKSIALLGNHDVQYIYLSKQYKCSGFQKNNAHIFHHLFMSNRDLFKYVHLQNDVLFTHAGVSKIFYDKCVEKYGIYSYEDLVDLLNEEPKELFYCSKTNGGWDSYDGPLWLRPKNYQSIGITQYVGHTYNKYIRRYKDLYVLDTKQPFIINN